MDYVGIDLHKNSSQVCILSEDGELVERRIKTDRESFDKLFGRGPPARILVESSTESEWCARHLEALGHEVIVADPNFAPMYATRDRRIKTDKRDARALCEACRLGAYRPAHRTSDRQRAVRAHLTVREALIRTRSKYIVLIGALAWREGCRIKAGPSPSFARRVEAAGLPAHALAQIEPLLVMRKALGEQIKAADKRLKELARADEVVQRLCSVPGVGPVVATTFAATFDDASCFLGAKHVRSCLGLVPREYSSGERQHRGRISKAGSVRARSLLVEAAWPNMAVHRSVSTVGQIADCVKAGAGSIFLTFLMLGLWQVFPKGVMRVYEMGNVRGVTLTLSRQGRGALDAAGVPLQCGQTGENCAARGSTFC